MPNRKEHHIFCTNNGISFEICDAVNEYMDYPSQFTPGCTHRRERHDFDTCKKLAYRGRTNMEALDYFNACEAHRDLDRSNSDNCGCLGLFQEYSRDVKFKNPLEPILSNKTTLNYDILLYDDFSSPINDRDLELSCSLRDLKRNKFKH